MRPVDLSIQATNHIGLVANIARVITAHGLSLDHLYAPDQGSKAICNLRIRAVDEATLQQVIRDIKDVEPTADVRADLVVVNTEGWSVEIVGPDRQGLVADIMELLVKKNIAFRAFDGRVDEQGLAHVTIALPDGSPQTYQELVYAIRNVSGQLLAQLTWGKIGLRPQPEARPALVYCAESQMLLVNGQRKSLTPLEGRLLRYFMQHQGEPCAIDDFRTAVWRDPSADDATIEKAINRLRKTIGDDATTPDYIATVRGVGYRLKKPIAVSQS